MVQQITKFVHRISKGSRFNQIYIPREFEKEFEVGDSVEIRLIEKKNELFYSDKLKRMTEFKEKLIREVFGFLSKYKEIKQILFTGSFLTKKTGYNDIDIVLVSKKGNISLKEEQLYLELEERFNLKFHILLIGEDKLRESLKTCPLVRSMFYYCISNRETMKLPKAEIELNHIRFLLMLPEDLLEVELDGRSYYNSLRRLVSIERFLQEDEIAPNKIEDVIENIIGKQKIEILKRNESLDSLLDEVRGLIKVKLKQIYKLIEKWEKTKI